MIELARVIARRSTCPRRAVGTVLVDAHGRILSMGHNGVAMGEPHCSEGHPCGGESHAHGVGLVACAAVHAEANALLFCPDVMRIDTLYATASPCPLCVRLLLNTSCRAIYFDEVYDRGALDRWARAGREWSRIASGSGDEARSLAGAYELP